MARPDPQHRAETPPESRRDSRKDHERNAIDRAIDQARGWLRHVDRDFWGGQRGPHSGRGPKNFRRTDDRIHDEVCVRMTEHGHLDPSELTVSVGEAEVTLAGTVESLEQKRLAEDIADSVVGVVHTQNNLRVRQR